MAGEANISAGMKLNFENNFMKLAQQKKSFLEGSAALMYMATDGKTNNLSRIGSFELSKVTGRNPNKSYVDYQLDNRRMTKERYTATIQIDSLADINELITNPTSDLYTLLVAASKRTIDKVAVNAAIGSVLVGDPDTAGTSKTAVQDGVITIDAKAGLNYTKIQQITENFVNSNLEISDIQGTALLISGTENTSLMSDEKFINNDYLNGNPNVAGIIGKTGLYETKLFAGSKTGGITVANPILPEVTTTRKCVALAPDSVAVAVKLNKLSMKESDTKVDSYDITIDLWISAMRTEGCRVQIIETTF